jgi:hypothetical protein
VTSEPTPPDASPADPATLTLDELRSRRATLQREGDVVSYVRRIAQARLDLVSSEMRRRERGEAELDLPSELRVVLSQHLTSGSGGSGARPPRPSDEVGDDELSHELDQICTSNGYSRLGELDDDELQSLATALGEFERRVSGDRRSTFEYLDALSAELVRRYRDGEASVDGLLSGY